MSLHLPDSRHEESQAVKHMQQIAQTILIWQFNFLSFEHIFPLIEPKLRTYRLTAWWCLCSISAVMGCCFSLLWGPAWSKAVWRRSVILLIILLPFWLILSKPASQRCQETDQHFQLGQTNCPGPCPPVTMLYIMFMCPRHIRVSALLSHSNEICLPNAAAPE